MTKRLAGIPVLLAAGLAAGTAWATGTPIVVSSTTMTTPTVMPSAQGATLALSSTGAGDRPIALTLKLHYEMQCGNPGTGYLLVKLPAKTKLPSAFPSGSAQLDGKGVVLTHVGTQLRAPLPPRPGVMCDVIGPGTLTFVVTKTANIGNPAKAGTYAVAASAGTHAFTTSVRIT